MNFVNEFVPEGKEFDPAIFYNPMNSRASFEPYRWTIDHEHDVYLICIGGGGREKDIPFSFIMGWGGDFVRIDAVKSSKDEGVLGIILNWKLINIVFPAGLVKRSEELLEVIEEGFMAMGREISRLDGIAKVEVQFNVDEKGEAPSF